MSDIIVLGESRRAAVIRFVPAGLLLGLALGVAARGWMRWISTEPEFSWSGTISIVVVFTLYTTAQAAARSVRARSTSGRKVAGTRLLAGVASLGLFGAAGAVMFPTVLLGSLAMWRSGMRRTVRVVLVAVAVAVAAFVARGIVDDHGWSFATIGRLGLFACIYSTVIVLSEPTVAPVPDGWRPPRLAVAIACGLFATGVAVALYVGGIQ